MCRTGNFLSNVMKWNQYWNALFESDNIMSMITISTKGYLGHSLDFRIFDVGVFPTDSYLQCHYMVDMLKDNHKRNRDKLILKKCPYLLISYLYSIDSVKTCSWWRMVPLPSTRNKDVSSSATTDEFLIFGRTAQNYCDSCDNH